MDASPQLSAAKVGDVADLKPQNSGAIVLTPETKVLCLHRGRNSRKDGHLIRLSDGKPELKLYHEAGAEPVERHPGVAYVGDVQDTFDSLHYIIAPGYFFTEYAAAKHFQARAVVPGSRNPETKWQASFIAIIGVIQPKHDGWDIVVRVDDAVQCEPFTDEECLEYGHAVEALDRSSMIDPIDRDVVIVPTRGYANEQVERSRLKGGSGAARGKTAISGPGKDFLKPGNTKPNEAMKEIAADRVASEKED